MTVEEFYALIGGDHRTALAIFKTEERIYKYLQMYAADAFYGKLCEAVEHENVKEAFEAAHAMKGITGTFYFGRLYEAVCNLVEQLRLQKEAIDKNLFEQVRREQEAVLAGIAQITS